MSIFRASAIANSKEDYSVTWGVRMHKSERWPKLMQAIGYRRVWGIQNKSHTGGLVYTIIYMQANVGAPIT